MLDHVIRLFVRHSTPVFSQYVGHFSTARHSPLAFQFPHLRKFDFLKERSFKPLQNFPTPGMKFKSVATPHLSHRGDVSSPLPYFQDPSSNCCVAEVGYKLLGLQHRFSNAGISACTSTPRSFIHFQMMALRERPPFDCCE